MAAEPSYRHAFGQRVVDAVLKEEQFRSFSQTSVPQDLVDMYTGNAAMIRDGGTALGEQECSQVLGGLRATKEEQLRGTISLLVLYT